MPKCVSGKNNFSQSYKNKRGPDPDTSAKSPIPIYIRNKSLFIENMQKIDTLDNSKKVDLFGNVLNSAIKRGDVPLALTVIKKVRDSSILSNQSVKILHPLILSLKSASLCELNKELAYHAVDALYEGKYLETLRSIARAAFSNSAIKTYVRSKVIDLMNSES